MKPSDTFIVQQSRGAKNSGAEVLYFAEKWRAIQNKLRPCAKFTDRVLPPGIRKSRN
jgi:hypothetical protein